MIILAHNSAGQAEGAFGEGAAARGSETVLEGVSHMGIETLQKAALAAGFVMATPDDDPPGDELYADSTENDWQLATGRSLVPLSEVPSRRAGARESLATAAAWIKDRLSMNGGRAPA